MNPLGSLLGWLTSPFIGLVSWAGEAIFDSITNWIAKAVVQLLGFVWAVMDATTTPHLDAEWFSGPGETPYHTALQLGGVVLVVSLLLSVMQGVIAGDVSGLLRRLVADLPLTVFAMVSLVGLTQAGIGLTDSISEAIWQSSRDDAVTVFDGLGQIASKMPGGSFLAPLVMLVLIAALLFLWLTLFIRDALVYLVVVLAAAFGLPSMVWPGLRGMARQTIELLAALVIAKPVIALSLSVGIGALGGVGATGSPGDGIVESGLAEFGTLVVGIICFGIAAFMPYLVYRLIPVAAAAAVAAGVASGPLRAASTGMQFQYYGQSAMARLAAGTGPAPVGDGEAGGSVAPSSSQRGSADPPIPDIILATRRVRQIPPSAEASHAPVNEPADDR